ncbi:CinA family protein [Spiroplasma endosymbiont of Acasis viretata]
MTELLVLLDKFNFRISCYESITGGLFAQEITSIAGASKYFIGGFITYTN